MSKQNRTGDVKVYIEENYFRHVDQIERWRQEHERNQAIEKKLASLSNFSFKPVDYEPLLKRVPWKERSLPDFRYIIEEARLAAESKFFVPIAIEFVAMIIVVFVLFLSNNELLLWGSAIVAAALGATLYITVSNCRTGVQKAVDDARAEVERRIEAERQKIEQERYEHELKEDERIEYITKLINTDTGAVILRLDSVLSSLDIPFYLEVDIEVFNKIPLVKVWFPPKTIIPIQVSNLLPSGRIAYEEKEQKSINKQYVELCAAIIVQVICKVYENIPGFDKGYVLGISKECLQNDCLVAAEINREKVFSASEAPSGLVALQRLKADFDIDSLFNFKMFETIIPAEWQDVPLNLIRNLHVKIIK